MIRKMKTTSFEQISDKEWQEIAVKSLRGLPFEKLISKTIEEIDIQPLYTKEQFEKEASSDHDFMLESIRTGINTPYWTIAQATYARDAKQFIEEVKESLIKGNEAILYDGTSPFEWKEEELKQLSELLLTYPIYAFNVDKNDSFTDVFSMIKKEDRKKVKGMASGTFTIPEGYHLLRNSFADTVPYHLQGADIITELALTLSKAAEESEKFDSFVQFSNQFFVRFAIDTHFFLEIAKLRAFRALWQTFAQSYGYEKPSRVPIYSETSLRTYSKLDPYVNLLRAGNEAFSAVLGGTDVLTVHPHNVLTEVQSSSVRYARNIQLVIKEETLVSYVLDPSGGSYFIDTLTNEMIEKAWELFVQIEKDGGYTAYVSGGALDKKLNQLYKERMDQLSHHRKTLVGTNNFADLTTPLEKKEGPTMVDRRLAEPYEKLRFYFEKSQPKTVLLTFGALKDFKPRADFIKGYLATAGIKSEQSPAFHSTEEALNWINTNDFDYGVICTPPKETEAVMEQLIQHFPADKWIDVAGSFEADVKAAWKDAGISGFIYKGQDQLRKLQTIKERWEEVNSNE